MSGMPLPQREQIHSAQMDMDVPEKHEATTSSRADSQNTAEQVPSQLLQAPPSPEHVQSPKATPNPETPQLTHEPLGLAANFNVFEWMLKDIRLEDIEHGADGVADLMSFLSKAAPRRAIYTPNEGLQAHLIRQQMIAGITTDKFEPMHGPRSRQQQVGPNGIRRSYRNPTVVFATSHGGLIPQFHQAKYQGSLEPLPVRPWYPALPGSEQGEDMHESRVNGAGVSGADQSISHNSTEQPYDASLFANAEEQRIITNFYVRDFLQPEILGDQPQWIEFGPYGADDYPEHDWTDDD
ncbi:uncharacterized protein N7459_008181 [Penicillium hispanicum]|uniref:uncharacterized protein n=1 Tax=Penicillium hispanicum TaxID=1080232 RepID=UPI0025421997|nr:uncharacterized protein N7459_008181 [Penicillium hispanicum]KAJ5573754.1 hypothetical protein N7459_008181 [Penicillium hispanicum]